MKVFTGNGKARCVISLTVVGLVLLTFGLALASSGGGHGGESSFNKGADLIKRLLNFAVLAGGLFFLLRKPVAKGLESRRQGIKDELDDLERRKEEAQREIAQTKQKLGKLDEEVKDIMAEAVREGEAAKAKILEEAKVLSEKLQEQAKKNIEHEFLAAKKQLKAEMADEAVVLAEAIIKKSINDDDQKRIVDEYLTKVVVAQ
jgi:F-type H+-transporting ATPase subunit b